MERPSKRQHSRYTLRLYTFEEGGGETWPSVAYLHLRVTLLVARVTSGGFLSRQSLLCFLLGSKFLGRRPAHGALTLYASRAHAEVVTGPAGWTGGGPWT